MSEISISTIIGNHMRIWKMEHPDAGFQAWNTEHSNFVRDMLISIWVKTSGLQHTDAISFAREVFGHNIPEPDTNEVLPFPKDAVLS
jgi:hypothetical protein